MVQRLSVAGDEQRYTYPEKPSQDEKVITGLYHLYQRKPPDPVPECLQLRSLPVCQLPGDAVS
jgi:hypothetical protein